MPHWLRVMEVNSKAVIRGAISSTARVSTRDISRAKISGLLFRMLNLKRDSVLECRFPACTSL